jgi:VRR-NUC domain
MRAQVSLTESGARTPSFTGGFPPRTSRAPVTEREFERAVLETLRVFGWRHCHFRPARTSRGWRTALSGDAGFPDIVAVRDERVLFIELKTERGRLSEEQGRWLAALGFAGADVHCWRPSDWPTIEETLR